MGKTIKDIMTENVITVSPNTSLHEVGEILRRHKISGMPVIDDEGNLVGIVTLTDLMRMLERIYQWKELEQRESDFSFSELLEQEKANAQVKDIMTVDVISLSDTDTLDEVMRIMFKHQAHSIPILRQGKLVGIVGKRDVINACF